MLTKFIPCFLQLIHELEFLLEDTPLEQLDESTEIRYQETIVELQNILLSKIDESTVLLLKVSFIQPSGGLSDGRKISLVISFWNNLDANLIFLCLKAI